MHASGSPDSNGQSVPYVDLIEDASATAVVIEVRTGDRAGLLYALGQCLAAERLSIRSAHISTLAGQAIDTFYLTEADGSRPNPQRAQRAVSVLREAASVSQATEPAPAHDAGKLDHIGHGEGARIRRARPAYVSVSPRGRWRRARQLRQPLAGLPLAASRQSTPRPRPGSATPPMATHD